MGSSFTLYSTRVLSSLGLQPASLVIADGIIQEVSSNRLSSGSDRFYDCGDSLIMPGLIDPHVHINEPGRSEWEGFDTATRAAAAGGVTSLVDMPLNSTPVTCSVDAFHQKIKATHQQLHVNCGFWGGVVPGNEKELKGLLEAGVLGLKAFLVHSGIDDFPEVGEVMLRKAMPLLAAFGRPLLAHCEIPGELDTGAALRKSPRHYPAYLASRPPTWEQRAIEMLIRLCWDYKCRSHIVHLSAAEALADIRIAKQIGLPLTVETCPQYLCLHAEDIPDGATAFKCAPPIRGRQNNEKLWQGLQDGLIDFIASDHSPAPPELKALDSGDFSKAWGGIAGLQFSLPLIWTAARGKGIRLSELANWLSAAPADFLGLGYRKGTIAAGYDADLVVWNPEAAFSVTADSIFHRHKTTPYLGQSLYGKVEKTFVNGALVYDNGQFKALDQGELILSIIQ